MLILNIEGQPFVQAVRLDDPSPGYAETYVEAVRRHLDPAARLRWVEVDVTSVAEFGPNDVAAMLSEDTQEAAGLTTDLPQRWNLADYYSTAGAQEAAQERRHEMREDALQGGEL